MLYSYIHTPSKYCSRVRSESSASWLLTLVDVASLNSSEMSARERGFKQFHLRRDGSNT